MRQVLPRPQRSTPVKGTPPRQPRRRRRLRRPQLPGRNRTRRRRSHQHRPHRRRTTRQRGRRPRLHARNNGDGFRRRCRWGWGWGWGGRVGTTRQDYQQNTRERVFPRTRHDRHRGTGHLSNGRPAPEAPTDRRRERTNRTTKQVEHPNPTAAEDTPHPRCPGTIRSRSPRVVRGADPTPPAVMRGIRTVRRSREERQLFSVQQPLPHLQRQALTP